MMVPTLKGTPVFVVTQRVGRHGIDHRALGTFATMSDAITKASKVNARAAASLEMTPTEYLDYLDEAGIVEGRVEVIMRRL